jgi:aminoglycoside phosphotransferase (APT) family kinase protein
VNAVPAEGEPVLLASGDALTVWEFIPSNPSAPYPAHGVGTLLARLHQIPLAEAERALGGPIVTLAATAGRGRARVEMLAQQSNLPGVPGMDPRTLTGRFDAIHAAFTLACAASTPVLLHGDVNPGNVLWGVLPEPVLCDFEALASGPWAWDLVNTQVAVALGKQPATDLDDMAAGYGQHPNACPGWAALCRLRAFNITTWHYAQAVLGTEDLDTAARLMRWLADDFPGLLD